jgi:hypothetical protein
VYNWYSPNGEFGSKRDKQSEATGRRNYDEHTCTCTKHTPPTTERLINTSFIITLHYFFFAIYNYSVNVMVVSTRLFLNITGTTP